MEWVGEGKMVWRENSYRLNEKEVGVYRVRMKGWNIDGRRRKEVRVEVVERMG